MDPRVYMLAGTFALLVIAVIGTIVSLARALRSRGEPARAGVGMPEKPRVELPASILVAAPSTPPAELAPPIPAPPAEPAPPVPARPAEPAPPIPAPLPSAPAAVPAWTQEVPEVSAAAAEPLPFSPEVPESVAAETPVPALVPEVPEPLGSTLELLPEVPTPYESVPVAPSETVEEEPAVASPLLGVSDEILEGPASLQPVVVAPDGLESELPAHPVEPLDEPAAPSEVTSSALPELMPLVSLPENETVPPAEDEPTEVASAALEWLAAQAAIEAELDMLSERAHEPHETPELEPEPSGAGLQLEPLDEGPAETWRPPVEFEAAFGGDDRGSSDELLGDTVEGAFLPEMQPAAEPAQSPVWLPPTLPGSEPQTPGAGPMASGDADALWQTLLRDQQDLPSIVTADEAVAPPRAGSVAETPDTTPPQVPVVLAAPTERPSVVVHQRDEELPAGGVLPPSPARHSRPRAVVRLAGDLHAAVPTGFGATVGPSVSVPLGERGAAPEVAMAAPVEIWFGDYRVGVKAGTKTYDQFRRYADTLLDDLRTTDG